MDNSKDTNKNEPTSPHFGKVWSTISFVNYKLSSVDKSYLPSQAKTSKWVGGNCNIQQAKPPSPLDTAPLIKFQKESVFRLLKFQEALRTVCRGLPFFAE